MLKLWKRTFVANCIFFLDMDFVLRKVRYASYNSLFQKESLQIALKFEEINEMSLDFIIKLEQLDFLQKEEELAENERKQLEEIFKAHKLYFLVCHLLWQKFGPKFNVLEINTLKYAIIFETNKSKSLLKEIEKLVFLQAKVTVLQKTYL